jgi:hypothetical protein
MNAMKMLGTSLSKREDRLAEASNLMLKSGNFQEYCEIQMSLGNFEDAIAYAPKVSMNYWKTCIENYQQSLQEEINGNNQKNDKKSEDPVEELASYNILMGQFQ